MKTVPNSHFKCICLSILLLIVLPIQSQVFGLYETIAKETESKLIAMRENARIQNKTQSEALLAESKRLRSSITNTTRLRSGIFGMIHQGASINHVPIAVPEASKQMTPLVALSYVGKSGNNMAGIGWNIEGVSSITRVHDKSQSKESINNSDPTVFNPSDRFILNGERLLLLSGKYGAEDSEYIAEQQSDIKIKAHGTSPFGSKYGPEYFTIQYSDGTKAWYGNGGKSHTPFSWALFKIENTKGIQIEYFYAQGFKFT